MHFLTIGFCQETNKQRLAFSLNNKQRKKGSKRIQMIIKIVTEFKLTVVNFVRPNQMQICACAWIYRWTKELWKIRTGPSRAVGRGPLGLRAVADRGPRAAGLLLAKPTEIVVKVFRKLATHGVFLYTKLEGQGKLIVAVKDKFRVRQRV